MHRKLPWYRDGLKFECTGCGGCCTGSPGYVWVNEREIASIAQTIGVTLEQFHQDHLRYVDGRYALRETRNGDNYDCAFLDGKRCTIYGVRPTQCRTYPWWPQNIDTPDDWKRAAVECEGIRPDAPLVPLATIESNREEYTSDRDPVPVFPTL